MIELSTTTLVQFKMYTAAVVLVELPSLQCVICMLWQLFKYMQELVPPVMLSPRIVRLLTPEREIGACAVLVMQNAAALGATCAFTTIVDSSRQMSVIDFFIVLMI